MGGRRCSFPAAGADSWEIAPPKPHSDPRMGKWGCPPRPGPGQPSGEAGKLQEAKEGFSWKSSKGLRGSWRGDVHTQRGWECRLLNAPEVNGAALPLPEGSCPSFSSCRWLRGSSAFAQRLEGEPRPGAMEGEQRWSVPAGKSQGIPLLSSSPSS